MARRRRDGRRVNENLLFIAFSPSVIFLRKMTAPSSEGACVGQPQGLSLRYDIKFNLILPENIFVFVSSTAGAIRLPHTVGYISNSFKTPYINKNRLSLMRKPAFLLNLMRLFNEQNTCCKEHLRKIIGYNIENLERFALDLSAEHKYCKRRIGENEQQCAEHKRNHNRRDISRRL